MAFTTKPISNIAMAFAAEKAGNTVEMPHARDDGAQEAFTGPSGAPPAKHLTGPLPTPPNSISPTLPPHALRAGNPPRTSPPVINLDSDTDLQDVPDHHRPQALSSAALSGLEAAGAITPAMLARDHLPDILLAHGPIAIRHVLAYLTQSVPGFSRIAPAKARRLVVSALESRSGGGKAGDVEFEKVGWGRWDARIRGQPPRERSQQASGAGMALVEQEPRQLSGLSPPDSGIEVGSYAFSHGSGLRIPRRRDDRRGILYGSSWAGESMMSSHCDHDIDEEMSDMNMAEHEADKMSLDGDNDGESVSSSSAAPEEPPLPLDMDDQDEATDEEDWASIGAEALRRGSMPSGRPGMYARKDYNFLSRHSTALAKSAPRYQHRPSPVTYQRPPLPQRVVSGPGALGVGGRASSASSCSRFASLNGVTEGFTLDMGMGVGPQNSQEREAVEALLRMGSM
ncbi:DNA-binding proteins Bright/BRCAA1/RBP1 and proteins containing BRIGHT domain [Coniosporium apollinis]|uniref:DNA-binding proteins Bright/BRCAA1/RBP1 and proteins containing BRIGHT domain n=2 Tax=Coniosporium TaxID=2810619 RepID=A0ABQ9P0Y9_9PEZI|nr:DNA-binding proteins Bright/BRCAA1/RBP1 and proteins containing BRIGHT domain [Cladosporium sp. JES 115]KAJ9668267.1 DNA-binding proteins Bright/BRCAA1/RBP1 and proteins containing BRIGHT domain [Coniosporium apollinis]